MPKLIKPDKIVSTREKIKGLENKIENLDTRFGKVSQKLTLQDTVTTYLCHEMLALRRRCQKLDDKNEQNLINSVISLKQQNLDLMKDKAMDLDILGTVCDNHEYDDPSEPPIYQDLTANMLHANEVNLNIPVV